jgi:hypothetical protein
MIATRGSTSYTTVTGHGSASARPCTSIPARCRSTQPSDQGDRCDPSIPTTKTVKVTFALPLGQTAGGCSVVGDFNEWQPGMHEMRRRANGTRSASVTVPRGTSIRFRYLDENGHWFNDPEVAELEGLDSVLSV